MYGDPSERSGGLTPPRGSRRGRRRNPTATRIAGVSAVALALTLGAGGIAGAATAGSPPTRSTPEGTPPLGGVRPAAAGTVKSVGTDSFTLTTHGGTVVTVDVTGATTYRDRGVTSPTLANVTVGSRVAVVGTMTSNTVSATSVLIAGPGWAGGPAGPGGRGWSGGADHRNGPGGVRPAAAGTVKSVGTDSFTLTTHGGTVVTVDVTGATTYRDRGVTSPTLANVTVGSRVAVVGTMTSNTVSATSVLIAGPGWAGGPDPRNGPGGMGG